jgi:membrane-associated phospholipid phosphatase
LAVLIIVANALDRIYTGAHWPSDVLAGILIAVAWISFWASLRWVSDRALRRPEALAPHR